MLCSLSENKCGPIAGSDWNCKIPPDSLGWAKRSDEDGIWKFHISGLFKGRLEQYSPEGRQGDKGRTWREDGWGTGRGRREERGGGGGAGHWHVVHAVDRYINQTRGSSPYKPHITHLNPWGTLLRRHVPCPLSLSVSLCLSLSLSLCLSLYLSLSLSQIDTACMSVFLSLFLYLFLIISIYISLLVLSLG